MIDGLLEFQGLPEDKLERLIKTHSENQVRGYTQGWGKFIQPVIRRYVIPLIYVKHLAEIPFDDTTAYASINGIVVIHGPSFDDVYKLLEQISLGTIV